MENQSKVLSSEVRYKAALVGVRSLYPGRRVIPVSSHQPSYLFSLSTSPGQDICGSPGNVSCRVSKAKQKRLCAKKGLGKKPIGSRSAF